MYTQRPEPKTAESSVVEFRGLTDDRRDTPAADPLPLQTPVPAPTPPVLPEEPEIDAPRAESSVTARREAPAGGATATDAAPARARRRSRLRGILMLGGIAAVVVGAGYFWLTGGRFVSADDAYVRAAKLMVSTDVSGIVASVDVKQGQAVKAGDVLFRVDATQFRIALDAARANLEQTRLTLAGAQQDYQRLQADILAQTAQLDLAKSNFERAQNLVSVNAGTRAAFDQARFTQESVGRTLQSLKQQAQVALIRLGGRTDLPIEQLPQYQLVKAQVDEAQRQLDHTTVRAPFGGIVTAVDTLQPGTYLVSQTAALTNTGAVGLVSNEKMWVEANLKETDLTYARSGNPVDVTIDAFPDHVWHGHVDSIFPASGSEFSILPAQNASGNWVKVVQRIPVHITLDRAPGDPPLRSGMSAVVEVDTGHTRQWSDLWPNWLPSIGPRTRVAQSGASGASTNSADVPAK